ncbi:D-alanine--D-alanine ligase [Gynuella sp.]|uniref:D-alanine--D-alanine ligase n=1 Tax=Gynuella sp. TaxID=2969146 RepID=UPI003D0A5D78
MSSHKIKVAVVFGGRSAEHEVSLQSAQNVINSLDPEKFEPVLIGIDREGRWFLNEQSIQLLNADNPSDIALNLSAPQVGLIPNGPERRLVRIDSQETLGQVDVIFPVLHGPYGEDGSIQGLAKMANLPCVGADVTASALGMDKDIMKRLLRDAGILNAEFMTLYHWQSEWPLAQIETEFGYPVFIKPANMGSSVGVSRAKNREQLDQAIRYAFKYDQKVLVEKAVEGRELEISLLGNDDIMASCVGEIVATDQFYSYESKYIDADAAELKIPADISAEQTARIQQTAIAVYRLLGCSGLARVDMFLTPEDEIFINEINTLPGFTNISMYPKLWEQSGMSQQQLVTRLIELALERFDQKRHLSTNR